MTNPFLKNSLVLSEKSKQELISYLLRSDPDCVIGIGIRIYLNQPDKSNELIRELQDLARVNPAYMREVIGQEAMDLLFPC